ncbi:hypothetical protein SCOCK_210015 [Actinacidiphila cocklensis]|uniref:Transposase Helix-turn-helix domain-containing protein n=1 Tax=Actinacidiphila cocklensis TaxID=887465 RepID=A0A9W4DLF1_9ACTN|nr:hypothetical protein SCOCK_210015 [Actinacidiphila cocklensis]
MLNWPLPRPISRVRGTQAPGRWVFDQESHLHQRLRMLVYPSGIDVSSSTLRFLSGQLRRHHRAIGSRWRRLTAGRQALLVLAHLRMGHTYAQLAAGFASESRPRTATSPRASTSWPAWPPPWPTPFVPRQRKHSCSLTAHSCPSTASPRTGLSTPASTRSTA